MKVSKLSSLVLTAVIIAGCGVNLRSPNLKSELQSSQINNQKQAKTTFKPVFLTEEDISKLDKEYMTFSTKALTISYLQKKLLSLIGSDNGVSKGSLIIKELMYYKEKTESIIPFKAMCASTPTLYSALTSVSAVITQRIVDTPFNVFIGGSNPLSTPNANAASNITSTGFTASWNVVTNASSGYILTIKQGTTTVNTINVSGQSTNSQVITGLNSSTAYTYTVQAKNGSLLSNSSNLISVSTTSGVINYTAVSSIAGDGTYGYQEGSGSTAKFNIPHGIVVDSAGNLYVTDTSNNRIRKIANDSNRTVSTYAGSSSGYQDGNGSSAQFSSPTGIVIDSAGNLYITDTNNHKIRKIANDVNHTVSTIAGSGSGYVDGNGTSAKFNLPYGIMFDSGSNIYISDTGNNRIRKIANDANHTVSTYAGSTTQYGYQDGDSTSARFSNPTGIAIDSAGNLYVTDQNNHKIRKIANDTNHTVSTYAGSSGGYQDSNGASAQFSYPYALTIDSTGNLYVGDRNNHKIRKILNDTNHTVSTISGGPQSYLDGSITAAKFNLPHGITIDSAGNLFVVDQGNSKIRKIQ